MADFINFCVFLALMSSILCITSAATTGRFKPGVNDTAEDPPMANTEYGQVQGLYLSEGKEARAFLGIPFAASPVGEFRWQPPQPLKSWDGVLQATKQPVGCPQGCGDPKFACPPGTDESCLYLDVYAPRNANSKSNLPVMFWLHGGKFQFGGAGGILCDARYIANISEVVVVTVNYRLGALGFMVTSGGDDRLVGNYGLLDQVAALRFVRDNIASFGGNPNSTDESCLYLDVYTPLNANSKSNLPVMFWLHGGNFQSGGAGGILYDARYIANISEVVVVTVNYRLGALGFMVTSGGDDRLVGNYGFLDQVAALRFVRDNIASFGGNPNSVTMFGQSAGAQSIACHMISEESESLFHQAIFISDPFTIPYQTPTRGAELGDLTAELVGCMPTDIECLKSRPASEILEQSGKAANMILDPEVPLQVFEPWIPVIDGTIVPADPLPAFQAGKFWRKPMIMGTTSEEGVLYIYGIWGEAPQFVEAYAFMILVFKDRDVTRQVIEAYDINLSEDLRDPLSAGCTDYIFGCSSRNASRLAHDFDVPIYHYIFDHAFSFEDGWGPGDNSCKGRVCHGGDLPFVFHTANLGGFQYTPTELRLTNSMVHYYGNFAHTGDPNNNKWSTKSRKVFEYWPEYSKANDWPSMVLKTPKNEVQNRFREDKCNLWDSVGYEENRVN